MVPSYAKSSSSYIIFFFTGMGTCYIMRNHVSTLSSASTSENQVSSSTITSETEKSLVKSSLDFIEKGNPLKIQKISSFIALD